MQPALVDRAHPLAAVDGAFNAVMLQGDAIREITLEGPGAGGIETASAVVADLVCVVGTTGTGFLQNDACWRELRAAAAGRLARRRSTCTSRWPTARACSPTSTSRLAAHEVSVAQLVQHLGEGEARIELVLHEAPIGAVTAALAEIAALPEVLRIPFLLPVITERAAVTAPVVVTLGEGSTPLLPAPRLSERFGCRALAEVGGREPDRIVQGPRHDRRRRRARSRRARTRSSAHRPGTRPPRRPRTPRAPASKP